MRIEHQTTFFSSIKQYVPPRDLVMSILIPCAFWQQGDTSSHSMYLGAKCLAFFGFIRTLKKLGMKEPQASLLSLFTISAISQVVKTNFGFGPTFPGNNDRAAMLHETALVLFLTSLAAGALDFFIFGKKEVAKPTNENNRTLPKPNKEDSEQKKPEPSEPIVSSLHTKQS